MSEPIAVNRPVVAAPTKRTPLAAAGLMLGTVGVGVFLWLSEARAAQSEQGETLPPLAASATSTPPPPMPATVAPPAFAAPPTGGFFVPKSGPVTLVASNPAPAPTGYAVTRPVPSDPMRERLHAPALVVDLAQADIPGAPGMSA